MLKIGDFSKLCQVSVKTLRFYDEVGLLPPIRVEPQSGYRYYAFEQMPRLNRILALRDLGFSLEEIGQLLASGVTLEHLRGMLRLRQAEQRDRAREEQERLARVEARLRQIEQEGKMPDYEVVIKKVEPQWVASIRRTIANYQAVSGLFGELYGYLGPLGAAGLGAALWHDEGHKESDVDAEAIVYLKGRVPEGGAVKVHEMPGATVASLVHHGAYNRLAQAYEALCRWIEANGYRISGPNRELYLHCPEPIRQDDESYITEIQFPVEKA